MTGSEARGRAGNIARGYRGRRWRGQKTIPTSCKAAESASCRSNVGGRGGREGRGGGREEGKEEEVGQEEKERRGQHQQAG
eukprot:750614-Hanusia_phi.AAC.2